MTDTFWESMPTEALARRAVVRPVAAVEELAAELWTSVDELEAFLADVDAGRGTIRPSAQVSPQDRRAAAP